MSTFTDSRKRSREDEICCDVPLSKRINNLHLTNFDEAHHHQQGGGSQQHHLQSSSSNGFGTNSNNNNNNQLQQSHFHHQSTLGVINNEPATTSRLLYPTYQSASHYQAHHHHHQHGPPAPQPPLAHPAPIDQLQNEYSNSHHHISMGANSVCRFHNIDANDEQLYDPELSRDENPYYYFSNKLLHQLHFERVKRANI